MDTRTTVEGNSVILTFEYSTGDAAGQNMVTICTDRICKFIVEHCPITPQTWYIESNYSGDKKATALSFINVRGKKLISEVLLHKEIVESVFGARLKRWRPIGKHQPWALCKAVLLAHKDMWQMGSLQFF